MREESGHIVAALRLQRLRPNQAIGLE